MHILKMESVHYYDDSSLVLNTNNTNYLGKSFTITYFLNKRPADNESQDASNRPHIMSNAFKTYLCYYQCPRDCRPTFKCK